VIPSVPGATASVARTTAELRVDGPAVATQGGYITLSCRVSRVYPEEMGMFRPAFFAI